MAEPAPASRRPEKVGGPEEVEPPAGRLEEPEKLEVPVPAAGKPEEVGRLEEAESAVAGPDEPRGSEEPVAVLLSTWSDC